MVVFPEGIMPGPDPAWWTLVKPKIAAASVAMDANCSKFIGKMNEQSMKNEWKMNDDILVGFEPSPFWISESEHSWPPANGLGEDSDDEFKRNVDGTAIQKTRSLPAKRLGPLWAGQIYPAYGPKWRERESTSPELSRKAMQQEEEGRISSWMKWWNCQLGEQIWPRLLLNPSRGIPVACCDRSWT